SRRRHTRFDCDWSSDVCSSDLDVVLPGRLLLDIVRALPAADVTIAQPGGTGAAQIECGPSRYSLNTQNAEDFPQLPIPSGSSFSDRKSTRLNSSHSQISYAVFC